MVTENPPERGAQAQLARENSGKFHTFYNEEIAELLPKNIARKEKILRTDACDNLYFEICWTIKKSLFSIY